MNMILTRSECSSDGVFGTLTSNDGSFSCVTLEHAFPQDDISYAPKTPPGTYTCVLGTHQLDHGGPFQCFQITNVPGHQGILIHIGNFNKDSDGCCLVGEEIQGKAPSRFINNSKQTWDNMMNFLGKDNFTLIVS